MAVLSAVGFAVATYLALYQVGPVKRVWKPFFGDSGSRVLNSSLSRLLTIPDAALGALAYLVEFVLELVGGPARWHTKPWVVLALGVVAAGMGLGSLALLQPAAFSAWCTFCLTSTVISFAIAAAVRDEVWATLQESARLKRSRHSLWAALRGSAAGLHEV